MDCVCPLTLKIGNIVLKCFFFFSSRRRHTRYWRDWSSDVCSSDLWPAAAGKEELHKFRLVVGGGIEGARRGHAQVKGRRRELLAVVGPHQCLRQLPRSEERREGKSVDLGGRRIIKKKIRR